MLSLDNLREIGNDAERQCANLRNNEQATKNVLIEPFMTALGYSARNTNEVFPEYPADVGTKQLEKVDYAILRDGNPIILFECKALGNPLGATEIAQLTKYYNNTDATVGILTDGVVYKFFSDLSKTNIMDHTPFWDMDISKADESVVSRLRQFDKDNFDAENIKKAAVETNIITGAKANLEKMYAAPDDEFCELILRNVGGGDLAAEFGASHRELVKRAFDQFVNDHSNTDHRVESPQNPPPSPHQNPPDLEREVIPPIYPPVKPSGEWQALSDVQPEQGDDKPAYIMLPDNKVERITAWNQVTLHTFRWLTENNHLTAAHCPIQRHTRYIVATQPIHSNGKRFKLAREVNSLHVELSLSIPDTIKIAQIMIEHVGLDASQFKLRW